MDEKTKQRLVGATVVISLGIIFLPLIFNGGRHTDFEKIQIEIPAYPRGNFSSVIQPLTPVEASLSEQKPPSKQVNIVEREGSKPIVDDEIANIIRPIERPEQIVNQPKAVVADKPAAKSSTKPVARKPPPKKAVNKPVKRTAKIHLPVTAWVVQVGSFDSRKNALSLRDTLRKNGFVSFVETYESAGKSAHRVRIGPETDRTRAEKILNSLRKKMSLSGIVVSYP